MSGTDRQAPERARERMDARKLVRLFLQSDCLNDSDRPTR